MNAAERAARIQGVTLYDEALSEIDERTLRIVAQRQRTARVRRRGWLVHRLLLAADLAGLVVSFLVAQAIFETATSFDRIGPGTEVFLFVATLPLWILVGKLYGLYDRDEALANHTTIDDVVAVVHMVTVGSWLFLAGTWLSGLAHPSFPKLLAFWALAIGSVLLARVAARGIARTRLTYLQNTVIVGAGDVGQLIARKLLQHPEYGINLVGFFDNQPREREPDLEHLAYLGGTDRLPALIRLFDIERVVIAFSREPYEETVELIRSLKDLVVRVDIVPRLFDLVSPGAAIHDIEGLPLVSLPPLQLTRSSRALKRLMDISLSLAGLLFFSPLIAYIAWRIKMESPGRVFFRQVRMGSGGRTFSIYKFRTMVLDADARKEEVAHLNRHNGRDARMFKIEDDPRTTRFGRFLRRSSLDELPQLINVLRGEMSLVGPRPLILDEDRHVDSWARKRLDLKPGMTGLWQVLGRSNIPFEEMVRLDYLYVTNWSLWNDVRLISRTLPQLVRAPGGSY